jgi:Protein of unknown function (DUF1566)
MFINATGNCVPRVVDLCPNIAGVQATIPAGMFINAAGNCVPRVVDLCPNIAGVQATIPAGMFINAAGNCVPVVDLCVIGGTGSGGGIVFYVASSPQPWGRCLEAAPSTWNGGNSDPNATWGCQGSVISGVQGTAIGIGQFNTTAIINACSTSGIAARLADDLVFGGKSDWFLPSKDELNLMYQQRTTIGGFSTGTYWSSSNFVAYNGWYQRVSDGFQNYGNNNDNSFYARPIRAIP